MTLQFNNRTFFHNWIKNLWQASWFEASADFYKHEN